MESNAIYSAELRAQLHYYRDDAALLILAFLPQCLSHEIVDQLKLLIAEQSLSLTADLGVIRSDVEIILSPECVSLVRVQLPVEFVYEYPSDQPILQILSDGIPSL